MERGQANARELANYSGVPMGRVYGVLNSLIKKGLIEVHENRPKVYRPRAIVQIVDKFLFTMKSKLDAEYQQLMEIGEIIKRQYAAGSKEEKDTPFLKIAIGEDRISELMCELYTSVKNEILVMVEEPETTLEYASLLERDISYLINASRRGVFVRLICSQQTYANPLICGFLSTVIRELNNKLEIKVHAKPFDFFEIIDRRYVVIQALKATDTPSVLIKVLSAELADYLLKLFEKRWREASYLKDIETSQLV